MFGTMLLGPLVLHWYLLVLPLLESSERIFVQSLHFYLFFFFVECNGLISHPINWHTQLFILMHLFIAISH